MRSGGTIGLNEDHHSLIQSSVTRDSKIMSVMFCATFISYMQFVFSVIVARGFSPNQRRTEHDRDLVTLTSVVQMRCVSIL